MRYWVALTAAVALNLPGFAVAAPAASEVLAAAKAASGGKAWDTLTGSYEKGTHGPVAYETWLDFQAYGTRMISVTPKGSREQGFDGVVAWRRAGSGPAERSSDAAAVREAVITAYVSNNGFFFPERFPAKADYLRDEAGFDVVRVEPMGGRPLELWFDRRTHLLGRIVDYAGPQPVAVSLSDYRRVGDVLVAFRAVVTGPSGTVLDEGKVDMVDHRPVDRSVFAPPKPR
ncbi:MULTISPECIES: hypothetical protein [unclassified Phenylobacterium]|uniref:hypothetical protein n=1 Tax=unclassified Phenylobacterium TaxID=2640670 RepID=UPI00083A5B2A|nr:MULTISPECIES: hypothetical protein [unclassified Phenylobacterium]